MTDGIVKVRELLILAATLPERDHHRTGVLAACWVDPWHRESLDSLTADIRRLVEREDLVLLPGDQPATAWERTLHRILGLPKPHLVHGLVEGNQMSVETLQEHVCDPQEEALLDEYLAGGAPPAQAVAWAAEATQRVRALDTVLGRFAEVVLAGSPSDHRGPWISNLLLSEALTSVYLCADASAVQDRLRRDVVRRFVQTAAGLESPPYPLGQQLLNGLELWRPTSSDAGTIGRCALGQLRWAP